MKLIFYYQRPRFYESNLINQEYAILTSGSFEFYIVFNEYLGRWKPRIGMKKRNFNASFHFQASQGHFKLHFMLSSKPSKFSIFRIQIKKETTTIGIRSSLLLDFHMI